MPGALLRQGSRALPWRATELARVMREALGHHMEVCFEAHFPQEGASQGDPDPHEFVSKAIQELHESRVMKKVDATYQQWLPIQARMVGCASASTYQGSTESPLWSASGPREWGAAEAHPTAMFACLTAYRARLTRTSAS